MLGKYLLNFIYVRFLESTTQVVTLKITWEILPPPFYSHNDIKYIKTPSDAN